jgi:5-methylcytosine-specific restriction endonuclease McrA
MKRCPKCKTWKEYSEFNKSKDRKDGFDCWCKSCKREKYLKDPQKVIDRAKKWQQKNPDKALANRKKYKKENREKFLVYYKNRHRYYKNGGATFTETEWQQMKEFYNFSCLCCGKTEPEIELIADHVIPSSLGGINGIENRQPLCGLCNSKKYNKTTDYRR